MNSLSIMLPTDVDTIYYHYYQCYSCDCVLLKYCRGVYDLVFHLL